jgi:hypothetical protein
MTSMTVDSAAVEAAAAGLHAAADAVPTNIVLDMGDCGSGTVEQAATSFNMWARLTAEIAQQRLRQSSGDALTGMGGFAQIDQQLAYEAMVD